MPTVDFDQVNKNKQDDFYDIPPVKEGDKKDETQDDDKANKSGEDTSGKKNEGDDTQAQPFKAFATEEEYNAWVEEEKKKFAPAAPAAPKEPEKEEELILYKGQIDPATGKWVGEAPKDWNQFARDLLTNPTARKMLSKQMAGEVATEIKTMTQKERDEMESINKGYDAEYNEIAKQGLLPPLNSEEGKKIDQQISMIGATYGLTSIKKSYELWKKIPVSQGGGLEYVPPKKANLNAQKQRAGGVSGQDGGSAPKGKQRTYNDWHNKSMDDLVDEESK